MPEKLSKSMTEEEFDCGYWYATEIKRFAKKIGFRSVSKLRKDELENLIKYFLRTGKIETAARSTKPKSKVTDNLLGLSLPLPVVNYADIKETKDFLMTEAQKVVPDLKRKSGAQYRLNRWREEQIDAGVKINYGDLVNRFIELSKVKDAFPQAPSGRYINFLSDFMKGEQGATRDHALVAWHELKQLNCVKNYENWKKHREDD